MDAEKLRGLMEHLHFVDGAGDRYRIIGIKTWRVAGEDGRPFDVDNRTLTDLLQRQAELRRGVEGEKP